MKTEFVGVKWLDWLPTGVEHVPYFSGAGGELTRVFVSSAKFATDLDRLSTWVEHVSNRLGGGIELTGVFVSSAKFKTELVGIDLLDRLPA